VLEESISIPQAIRIYCSVLFTNDSFVMLALYYQ